MLMIYQYGKHRYHPVSSTTYKTMYVILLYMLCQVNILKYCYRSMLAILLLVLTRVVLSDRLLLGYLTGSQRRPGDHEYQRPGLTISGAISLAVAEVNAGPLATRGHSLEFVVAETYGEETTSIRQIAALWTRNVSAYIGPQETCVHEGRMAAAFNLAMISYVTLFCPSSWANDLCEDLIKQNKGGGSIQYEVDGTDKKCHGHRQDLNLPYL
ncbi:hypothetical protein J6590_074378 [Homalodisca vitripennis]|nr:hypothetical protein J6590_074378 [Homalodisca vitripennis]